MRKQRELVFWSNHDWDDFDLKSISMILCLEDEVKYNIVSENTTVWL